jgi:hypothetical protein
LAATADLQLLDDAGSALERMGQAEQSLRQGGADAVLLQFKDSLGESRASTRKYL